MTPLGSLIPLHQTAEEARSTLIVEPTGSSLNSMEQSLDSSGIPTLIGLKEMSTLLSLTE
ncbi:hypothetical protein D3C81_737920 [compost metagenome]